MPTTTDQTTGSTTEIIPYIRRKEVLFYAKGLRADKEANTFFDETNVTGYCQVGNPLVVSAAANAGRFNQGDGIVCSTSNAFAKVITTSNNIVYLNENFITFNIAAYGANTLAATDYTAGEIVYQTSNTTNTSVSANIFVGKIEYYNNANGVLAVSPISGFANTASGSNTIYKIAGTVLSNTTSVIRRNKYVAGGVVYNPANLAANAVVSSYTHFSAAVATANSGNTVTIHTQANVASSVVGNTLYITAGTGIGQSKVISAVTDNTEIRVASAWATQPDSTSKYSIGKHIVDDYGTLAGIFQLPEETSIKFLTGERVFTISDAASPYDESSSIFATAKYVAMGSLSGSTTVTSQSQVSPDNPTASGSVTSQSYNSPPPPVDLTVTDGEGLYGNITNTLPKTRRYPLAQTFHTPEPSEIVDAAGGNPTYVKQDYGMFISSVDLFFKAKPTDTELQLPVGVYIVETINGFPSDKVLGFKVIDCSQVNISDIPDSSNTSTMTRFTFGDPIYIAPKTEYALVIGTESPDYQVWISELGGVIAGSNPERRVSEQPYTGSLFKSQNASTWTPFQNEDLMFIINKAVFDKTNKAYVSFTVQGLQKDVLMDSIILHSTEKNFKPTKTLYRMLSTVDDTGILDTDGIVVLPNKHFNLGEDLKISSKTSKRRRILKKSNANSFIVNVEFSSADSDVSPVINLERLGAVVFKNEIDNANIASRDIVITNGGNHSNSANINVAISAPDDPAGTQATANVLASQLVSNKVTGVNIIEAGSGYYGTPTITLSEPAASSNATATIAGEAGSKVSGLISAKYISKEVRLAEGFDAGDLRVYIDAIRPAGTHVDVYYKVLSRHDSDKFADKTWQRMEKYAYPVSVDQNTIVELQFRPSLVENRLSYTEGGVAYPLGGTFRSFAIKITLTANDPTVAPIVKNYRTIATPAG